MIVNDLIIETKPIGELSQLWIVIHNDMEQDMMTLQKDKKHQISPMLSSKGLILCADILTEINGIYKDIIAKLINEYNFGDMQIIHRDEWDFIETGDDDE
jgi:ATP-dependent helicase/DNAse subunit B